MTESEIIEAMTQYFGLVADMLTLYLTSTSGYLVVAYLIGAKITRSQLITFSSLYLIFAVVSSYLALGYGLRGLHYANRLSEMNPATPLYATPIVPAMLGISLVGGIFASLWFMWKIRRPGEEGSP